MQIPVVGEQLQTLFGKPHVEGALTGDQAGCRTFWTGFTWHVWKIKTMLKKGFQIRIQMKRCGGNSKFSSRVAQLTEAPADVDVEVNAVVTVVHQEAVAHFDQRAEVVLLAVRVQHVTWHLDTAFIPLLLRVPWFLTREYLTSICQLWAELLFWPRSEGGDKIN